MAKLRPLTAKYCLLQEIARFDGQWLPFEELCNRLAGQFDPDTIKRARYHLLAAGLVEARRTVYVDEYGHASIEFRIPDLDWYLERVARFEAGRAVAEQIQERSGCVSAV